MGRVGRMRPSLLCPLLALALAACDVRPTHPFGRWAGRVGDPCPGTALLDARRGEAVFVRDDGAQVLRGTATPEGQVSTRVETPGVEKKGFIQTFIGQIKGDEVTGTYTSPRCTAPVTMHAG